MASRNPVRKKGSIPMKVNRNLFVWPLVLVLLFSGCGRRLDPETLALAEESDIICLAYIGSAEAFPETGDGYCILACQVREDYLGSRTEGRRIFVLLEGADLDMDAYRDGFKGKTKYTGQVILFLKYDPEDTVYHGHWSTWPREFRVFVPAGKNALRWGGIVDAAGLRLREALWAYGKTRPGEKITRGIYYI